MRPALAAIGVLLVVLLCPANPAAPAAQADPGGRAVHLHEGFDHESFRQHAPAERPIAIDRIDHDLLSAAVFHETNRRRVLQGYPVFRYRPEVREAARLQAEAMARIGAIGHRQRAPGLRTVMDRLEHVGLQPAFGAENVAMTFGIRYESGTPVYTRQEGGRTVFSYEPEGPAIPPHTYRSFAEALVEQWMRSPSHRRNILHEAPTHIGTAHQHARNEQGMDVFYSAQVFFRELPVRKGRQRR